MLELYRDLLRRHLDLLVSQPIARLFPAGGVYEPLHRPDVRADLERQTQERFAFLPNDHGFSPYLDPDPSWAGTWIDYRSKDIGVSIQFEYYEHEMWVELVKLTEQGQKAPAFKRGMNGPLPFPFFRRCARRHAGRVAVA